jgi:hypothetical protein
MNMTLDELIYIAYAGAADSVNISLVSAKHVRSGDRSAWSVKRAATRP